jgi:hypothetical protein
LLRVLESLIGTVCRPERPTERHIVGQDLPQPRKLVAPPGIEVRLGKPDGSPSSDEAEEGTELFDEELGLFEGREVATPLRFAPITDVMETALCPAAGRPL